jgi:hypothetical protein
MLDNKEVEMGKKSSKKLRSACRESKTFKMYCRWKGKVKSK